MQIETIIKALIEKQCKVCDTISSIEIEKKLWNRYFVELNKYFANKRNEVPYFENGRVV